MKNKDALEDLRDSLLTSCVSNAENFGRQVEKTKKSTKMGENIVEEAQNDNKLYNSNKFQDLSKLAMGKTTKTLGSIVYFLNTSRMFWFTESFFDAFIGYFLVYFR